MPDAVVHRLPSPEPIAVVRVVDEERQMRPAADGPPAAQRPITMADRVVEDLDPETAGDGLKVVDEDRPREQPTAARLAGERPSSALGPGRCIPIFDAEDLDVRGRPERHVVAPCPGEWQVRPLFGPDAVAVPKLLRETGRVGDQSDDVVNHHDAELVCSSLDPSECHSITAQPSRHLRRVPWPWPTGTRERRWDRLGASSSGRSSAAGPSRTAPSRVPRVCR